MDGWMDRKHRRTVGWIDKWMAGSMDIKNMVGWTGKNRRMVGLI